MKIKKQILSLILIGIFAILPVAASENSEYSIQINDKITIGTRRAYECSATIAHLAGFQEFNRADFQQCAKDEFYRAKEKLVYKFVSSRLCFAYDDKQRLFLNSANILIPEIEGMSVKTVLAFLNSSLFNFLYVKRFGDLKILKGNLCALPFPRISNETDQRLSALVDEALKGNTDAPKEIDRVVFSLYQLGVEETQLILEIKS